jgi:predicted ATP-dependent endonuclease of OLD family
LVLGAKMQSAFIANIHIGKVRHLENLDIPLSGFERKHLILTGKNGSGKTSLLDAMRWSIQLEQRKSAIKPANVEYIDWNNTVMSGGEIKAPEIVISYSEDAFDYWGVTFAYVSAARNEAESPKAIEAADIQNKNFIARNASKEFLKYALNLYVQYLSAKDSGESPESIKRYEAWLENFESALRDIYSCPQLALKPDMKNLAFRIEMPGREPFRLNEMSDGYKAFIDIYMELLLRFEAEDAAVDYGKPAIVLIDEIEAHLHVELQKRALPFLTKSFPNVQFIVATHSPFVTASLANAAVYDLDKKEQLDNPSLYLYESLVESFLGTGAHSLELRDCFERYKELCFKKRSLEENEEFLRA